MCLIIDVFIRDRALLAPVLAAIGQADGCFAAAAGSSRLPGMGACIAIADEAGCACGLLADDADSCAATWSMAPAACAQLRRTLAIICRRCPEFGFQALWVGDRPAHTVTLTGSELLGLIDSSALGTRTRYAVRNQALA